MVLPRSGPSFTTRSPPLGPFRDQVEVWEGTQEGGPVLTTTAGEYLWPGLYTISWKEIQNFAHLGEDLPPGDSRTRPPK